LRSFPPPINDQWYYTNGMMLSAKAEHIRDTQDRLIVVLAFLLEPLF